MKVAHCLGRRAASSETRNFRPYPAGPGLCHRPNSAGIEKDDCGDKQPFSQMKECRLPAAAGSQQKRIQENQHRNMNQVQRIRDIRQPLCRSGVKRAGRPVLEVKHEVQKRGKRQRDERITFETVRNQLKPGRQQRQDKQQSEYDPHSFGLSKAHSWTDAQSRAEQPD